MLPARELIQLAQSAAVPAFPRVKVAAGCTAWMGALHTSQRGALVWWYWLLAGRVVHRSSRRSGAQGDCSAQNGLAERKILLLRPSRSLHF